MKRIKQIHGFTLLEVLTAMAIIAVMIGLLIPAIGKIQTMASVVKQRAQFNAIGAALEAFRSDSSWNDYPPSSYTDPTGTNEERNGFSDYCGAQKLAEALVGWDGFGFHPQSQWRSDGLQDTNGDGTGDAPLYYGSTGFAALLDPDKTSNLGLRKGPYLELEKANAVKIKDIYPTTSAIGTYLATNTYVLADMFSRKMAAGKKTGMPILYFKADTTKLWTTDPLIWSSNPDPKTCIYNIGNNAEGFIKIAPPWDATQNHPMRANLSIFYQRIKNPNFPGTLANNYTDARPYRNDSFILLSAGPDGLYGTADDVYNFDENN